MRTFSQDKVVGRTSAADFHSQNQRRLEELQFFDSVDIVFKRTSRGISARLVIRPSAPAQAATWQTPNKELDPTVAVSKGTRVYISPGNALVVTGLTDLVSGVVVNSPSGSWEALQDVPAQVTIAGVVNYNVPQLPYPGATGTPSGSPLAGDLDGPQVFWYFNQENSVCV